MRESIEVGLDAVVDDTTDSNIEHGSLLTAFAEAIVGRDEVAIAATRQTVVDAMGGHAMVDAAGVVSNFERNDRVADGTGIPLGDGLEGFSAQTREQLGFDRWRTN